MKRKVIQYGNSSLSITLPNKWVKQAEIRKGDEIDLSEDEGNLIIGPMDKAQEKSKIELTLKIEKDNFTKRIIENLYRKGYDEVIINYKNSSTIKAIQDALDVLIGFEIIEQADSQITISNLMKGMEDTVEKLMNKSFFVTKEISRLVLEDITSLKSSNNVSIYSNFRSFSKFENYSYRFLLKKKFIDKTQFLHYYFIFTRMSMVRHRLKYIYEYYLKKNKPKLSKDAIIIYKEVMHAFDLFYQSLVKKDFFICAEIEDMRWRLDEKITRLLEKNKGVDNFVYAKLYESFRFIHEMAIRQVIGLYI